MAPMYLLTTKRHELSSSLLCAGGNVGLMGEIARAVAAGLGPESVIGVIPSHLQSREVQQICFSPDKRLQK